MAVRPLNPVYPFLFIDCINYKVREDGRILSRAAYIVLGVTLYGYKDIRGITVSVNETSKFWLGMLNDLKNRGVQDVLFFCVDGLPGFKEAIQAVYPQTDIQHCVIYMLRNSFKYINFLLQVSMIFTSRGRCTDISSSNCAVWSLPERNPRNSDRPLLIVAGRLCKEMR